MSKFSKKIQKMSKFSKTFQKNQNFLNFAYWAGKYMICLGWVQKRKKSPQEEKKVDVVHPELAF